MNIGDIYTYRYIGMFSKPHHVIIDNFANHRFVWFKSILYSENQPFTFSWKLFHTYYKFNKKLTEELMIKNIIT